MLPTANLPAISTPDLAKLIKLDSDGVHCLHEVIDALFGATEVDLAAYSWQWKPELHAFHVSDQKGRVRECSWIPISGAVEVTDVKSGQKARHASDSLLLRRLQEPVNFVGDHDHTPPNHAVPAYAAIVRAKSYFLHGPRIPRNEMSGEASDNPFAKGRPPVVHTLLGVGSALSRFEESVRHTQAPDVVFYKVLAIRGLVDKFLEEFCIDPNDPLRKHMLRHGLIDADGFEPGRAPSKVA